MELDHQIFNRLRAIPWFSRCGDPPDPAVREVLWIGDWPTAINCFSDPNWEDTTLQARNALTTNLASRYPTEFQEWNALTDQARARLLHDLMPQIRQFQEQHGLPPIFNDCVRWDLLGAVMEATYKSRHPPKFFGNLFSVYERGRFPCGWKGEWPNGRLMVI
jgi:hypothetical protein